MPHLGTVGTATQNSSATAVAITLTDDVPVGATILIGACWDAPAGTIPTVSSVVDSSGNTYTTTPDTVVLAGTTLVVGVIRGRVTTALDSGDTITVTLSASRARWCLQVDAFDDVDAAPLDETATNAPGSSSSLSTGTTATTGQALELLFAVFGFGTGRSVTVPGGWAGGAQVATSAGSTDRALQVIHKYVNTVGTQQGTLTLSSTSTYGGAIATYTYTSTADPVARVAQVKVEAPLAGSALIAKVSQVKFEAPTGVTGEARVAQVKVIVPSRAGQPPYSGIKASVDGSLRDATISSTDA